MKQPLYIIEKLKKHLPAFQIEGQPSSPDQLAMCLKKIEVQREELILISDQIGVSVPVTLENVDDIEWFANFIRSHLYEFARSIRIYLKILEVAAHKSTVYRTLVDIYLYDVSSVANFNFLQNALAQFSTPIHGLDPIFYCMSYTYIGMLSQRLGYWEQARSAFSLATEFKNDPRKIHLEAEYGLLELNFLASVASKQLFSPVDSALKNDKPQLLISSIFFGEKYTELFEKSAGKTFFCSKNIRYLKENWCVNLVLFCSSFDKILFQFSPLFKRLSKNINMKFIIIPDVLMANFPHPIPLGKTMHPALPYSLSGLAQTCFLILAKQINASLITLPPDAVFSNTTLSTIVQAVKNGKTMVLTPGIRLNRESVLNELSLIADDVDGLSASQLTKLAMDNLHPATEACFCTNEKVTYPGIMLWPVTQKGLLGHAFQMHPIFIKDDILTNVLIRRFDSIDGDFVYLMLPSEASWQQIHVVTEPSETMMFELSGPEIAAELKYKTHYLASNAGYWMMSVMRPFAFWLLKKQFRFGNFNNEDAKKYILDAKHIVDEISILGQQISCTHLSFIDEMTVRSNAELSLVIDFGLNNKLIASERPLHRIGQRADDIRVLYTIAVWGKDYIKNFLHIGLPSLISEGNLANSSNNQKSLFLLYTKQEDVSFFEENRYFRALKKLIVVEIIIIQPESVANKYTVLSKTQSDAVQRSRAFDAICFLYSDFVWARGGLTFAIQKLAEGYEGVVSPVPPLIREDFYETLANNFDEFTHEIDGLECISVSPRTLVKYAKPIMHPMMRDNNVDFTVTTTSPAYVLWQGPNDDLIIRCFHTHPVILKVKHDMPVYWVPFEATLDEGFLPIAYPSTDKLYFIKDSDEVAIISLTERDFPTPYLEEKNYLDAAFISQWAESCATPMHKMSFNYSTIWHEHDIETSQWQSVTARSAMTAQEVSMRLSLPDSVQLSENAGGYQARYSRIMRYKVSSPSRIEFQDFKRALIFYMLMILKKIFCLIPVKIRKIFSVVFEKQIKKLRLRFPSTTFNSELLSSKSNEIINVKFILKRILKALRNVFSKKSALSA